VDIVNLALSPYELTTHAGERRPGFLLRLQESEGEPGYADIFPWTVFGDPSIAEIPSLLQDPLHCPPLLERSLAMARLDSEARSLKRNLLEGVRFKNHALVLGESFTWMRQIEKALSDGFRRIKIKVGHDPKNEIKALHELKYLKKEEPFIRLDCNTQGTKDFFNEIEPIQPLVEWVEDPFSKSSLWKMKGWTWAYDHPGFPKESVAFDIQVIKPAKQNFCRESQKPYLFTSYLDHPVGVAHALHQAALYGEPAFDYGLMSLNVYQETPFHEAFKMEGPWLSCASDGPGVGFTTLFERLDWVNL
jgi:hypothetical protein